MSKSESSVGSEAPTAVGGDVGVVEYPQGNSIGGGGGGDAKHKEIYTYETPWTAYAMAWCRRPDEGCRYKMAIGSYKEEYSNLLQIIQLQSDHTGQKRFRKLCEIDHPYPPTKVMWAPPKFNYGTGTGGMTDLLATTGDYLRLWSLDADNKADMKAILNNNKHTEYCAPLTSFDWNEADPSILGTCSIDTTCTIWDVTTLVAKTQLIAHDKEVYDIAFASGINPTLTLTLAPAPASTLTAAPAHLHAKFAQAFICMCSYRSYRHAL